MNIRGEQQNRAAARWAKKNPEKVKFAKKLQMIRHKDLILAIKKEKSGECSMCKFSDIRILQFHHLRDKRFNIANARGRSEKLIRTEAEKCVLLCPNCHAIVTLESWAKRRT